MRTKRLIFYFFIFDLRYDNKLLYYGIASLWYSILHTKMHNIHDPYHLLYATRPRAHSRAHNYRMHNTSGHTHSCHKFIMEAIVLCLKSKRRLEREKGLLQLKNLLKTSSISPDELQKLQEALLSSFSSTTWEEIHGAVMAAMLLVPVVSGEEWTARVKKELPQLLQHKETRVGTAAGEL